MKKKNKKKNEGELYILIPQKILQLRDLSPNGKILLGVIYSLDNEDGCYASNSYLSKIISISAASCSIIIGKLSEAGYIKTSYEHHSKNSVKVDKRTIRVCRDKIGIKPNNYKNKFKNIEDFNDILKECIDDEGDEDD